MKQESVVVLVETKNNDWQGLPRVIQESLSSGEAGQHIPKTVVADPDLNKVISIVPYLGNPQERTKRLREAEKQIRAELAGAPPKQETDSGTQSSARGEADGQFPRTVICGQDVDAFNPSNPAQALGKFLKGSSLTLESKDAASGMFVVLYKQPNGNEVRALCRPRDLTP